MTVVESKSLFPARIPSSVVDELARGKCSLSIDKGGNALKISKVYNEADASRVMDLFLQALEEMDKNPKAFSQERKFEIVQASTLFLKNLVSRYHRRLDKGFAACRRNPFLMKISKLDRFIVATNLREVFGEAATLKGRQIELHYKTKVSRDLLEKWMSEPTHEARKKDLSTKVVQSALAQEAFFFHPQDVDFVMDNFVHKQVARHDEQIMVDPITKHVMVKYEGRYTRVDKIREDVLSEEGRMYGKTDGQRYFYRYDKGLTRFDPVEWKELPVFKRRREYHGPDDYHLVIKTVEGNGEKHSWIELKDPRYKYNVGFFWKEGEETQYWNLCQSVRGILHVADKHEYMGEEKAIIKTDVKISKEEFEKLKQEIEKFQADPSKKSFNLVNGNCTSWVRNLVAKVGVKVSTKGSVSEVLLGIKMGSNFLWRNIPPLRWLKICGSTILSIFRNLLMYCLGGGHNREVGFSQERMNPHDRAFPTFWHIFKPSQGLFDHPKILRQWQAKVEEEKIKMIEAEQAKVKQRPFFAFLTPAQRKAILDAKAQEMKFILPEIEVSEANLKEDFPF